MKLRFEHRLRRFAFAICIASLPVSSANAAVTQVPIAGDVLKLRASQNNPAGRRMTFRSAIDPAIAAPFPDPTLGASLLVFASNSTGHCRAEVSLPAIHWQPLRGDGPNRGWRYLDPNGSAAGVFKVVVKPRGGGGIIVVKANGPNFPCGLQATAQQVPIAVALRIEDTRYCASFAGADVTKNQTGRFKAEDATAPAACPDSDLTAANINVLHGFFCPEETEFCRLVDRIDLFGQWIVERGCPDVIAVQEAFQGPTPDMVMLIQDNLTSICPFTYQVVYVQTNPFDDSLLLSRYPVISQQIFTLKGNVRHMLHARLDHPIGPVDAFSTHLAAGSDFANNPCNTFGPCPQACINAGATTIRECQGVQVADRVQAVHDTDAPAILMGDFNAEPGSFVYQEQVGPGWLDTYLAAGNPECAPLTGIGCTSGREDEDVVDLESSALNVDARIDYIFLVPPGPASLCAATLDTPLDADGDAVATRLFADQPNPFSPTCGPSPDPICWVSDHTGTQADVNCE